MHGNGERKVGRIVLLLYWRASARLVPFPVYIIPHRECLVAVFI